MSKQFEFADFIDEFRVDFVYIPPPVGSYIAGRWVEDIAIDPETIGGIILPLSEDDFRKSDNGVYTDKDRKVYTTKRLAIGGKVIYKEITYTVDREKDYSDYADVYIYMAKGAGAIDRQ